MIGCRLLRMLLLILAVIKLPWITPSLAEPVTNSQKNGDITINIETAVGAASDEVHIKIATTKIARSSVFVLENPSRIVIDLFGPQAARNKELVVKNNLLSNVRVGSHSDKTRVVIDLKGETIPPYSWSESKAGALLKINFKVDNDDPQLSKTPVDKDETLASSEGDIGANDIPEQPKPVFTPTATIAKSSTTEDNPLDEIVPRSPPPTRTPTAIPVVTQAPTITPTSIATKVTTETTAPDSESSAVEVATATVVAIPDVARDEIAALEFGYSGSSNSIPTIKLKLGAKSEFELRKVDEKTYKLQIPNTRIVREALKLPQFPPHDFVGFNMILLQQFDSGVEMP